jgi:excisionase family DNA binding protein
MAELLKLAEVADELGIAESTCRRYIKSGEIPSLFVGGRYRVRREVLDEYLRAAEYRTGGTTPGRAGEVAPKGLAPGSPSMEREPRRSSPDLSPGLEGERPQAIPPGWTAAVVEDWQQGSVLPITPEMQTILGRFERGETEADEAAPALADAILAVLSRRPPRRPHATSPAT